MSVLLIVNFHFFITYEYVTITLTFNQVDDIFHQTAKEFLKFCLNGKVGR